MARKLGNEVMMDILKEYQVEYVFGIPGATEIHFMEGIEATPEIQYILGLNEMVCVGAAEGYARAKNKPAVLNLHTGNGSCNAAFIELQIRKSTSCYHCWSEYHFTSWKRSTVIRRYRWHGKTDCKMGNRDTYS